MLQGNTKSACTLVRFPEAHHACIVLRAFPKNAQLVLRFQNAQLVLHFSKRTASAVFSKNVLLALRFPEPCYMLTSIHVSQHHSPRLYVTSER